MSQPPAPWLSIITACYNDSKNLEKTIQSLKNQQVDFVECIVIDGNSTDDTLRTIQSHQQTISFWISERDTGVYDAMNKGIKMAKGQYILFLNAGDTFYKNTTLQDIKAQAQNEDILYGDAIFVYKDGTYKSPRHKILPTQLNWKSFRNGMVVCHQALLISSNIIELYNLKYKVAADIDWAIRCVQKAHSIKNLNFIISNFQFGGISDIYKYKALLERWYILVDHFGIFTTIISHFKMPFTYMAWKVFSMYKKYSHK